MTVLDIRFFLFTDKECYQKSKTKKKTKENDFSNLQFM